MFAQGRLKPHVSATYPLDRVKDAMRALMARQVVGKLVLTV
jgi:NADPH:quinone reductase